MCPDFSPEALMIFWHCLCLFVESCWVEVFGFAASSSICKVVKNCGSRSVDTFGGCGYGIFCSGSRCVSALVDRTCLFRSNLPASVFSSFLPQPTFRLLCRGTFYQLIVG